MPTSILCKLSAKSNYATIRSPSSILLCSFSISLCWIYIFLCLIVVNSLIIKVFVPNLQTRKSVGCSEKKRDIICWHSFPKVLPMNLEPFFAIILMDVFKIPLNCFPGVFHAKSFHIFAFRDWKIMFPPARVRNAMFVLQFCNRSFLFAPCSTLGHVIHRFSLLLVFRSRAKMAAKATQDQSCDYKYQGPEKYHDNRNWRQHC